MTKLVIHVDVDDEFLKAYLWYAKRSRPAAERFKALVRQAFDGVIANPVGGTVYDAGHRFYRLRKYPHLVIYRLLRRNRHSYDCRYLAPKPRSRLLAGPMIADRIQSVAASM